MYLTNSQRKVSHYNMRLSLASISLIFISNVSGFQNPNAFVGKTSSFGSHIQDYSGENSLTALNFFSMGKKEEEPVVIVEQEEQGLFAWTDFGKSMDSYVSAGAWVGLLVFAAFLAPGEFNSASDTAMIENFIANPSAPDLNPFFLMIFNLLGLPAAAYACTSNPRASTKGGLPSTVPMLSSLAFGYFAMGTYLFLRKTPETEIMNSSEQLGWFTRNVLENKIFNVAMLGLGAVSLAVGASAAMIDPVTNWNEFLGLLTSSKFVAVSTSDLLVLTLFLTKEVADDYRVRCSPEDIGKANLIGASTALLPMIGALMYCVARPSLAYEEE